MEVAELPVFVESRRSDKVSWCRVKGFKGTSRVPCSILSEDMGRAESKSRDDTGPSEWSRLVEELELRPVQLEEPFEGLSE